MKGVFVNDSGVFNAAGDYWVGCVPVKNLKDSKDVQQVKAGDKGKHGVTNPITGEFQQETEAIYVWRRKNGDLEVISGRHKFALALETNTPSVLCYVFNEDAKHDAKWARLLDFENNMRSDQADELTCGLYVRETGYDDATLRKKGLMRNKSRSKRGILIGRAARGELWGRFKSGTVKPKDAEMICLMTKDITDESRIDAIQRECCDLLEQRKSWEYISAMVQQMASEENVQISQGLFDFGADFHEQMERTALFIEKNIHALNDAISVMKQGRKLATTKKDLAERLGTATTTREGSGKLLQDLIELKARYENFGLYPELTEAARLWDGKSEPDPIAQAMGLTDAENERLAAEAGMSREEWEEARRVAEAKREAEKATGSLFGDGGSFSVTEARERGLFDKDGVLEAENATVFAAGTSFSIIAYHVSPNDFDKFKTKFIGEGLGVRLYGWGIYFTDDTQVNEYYISKFKERTGKSPVNYRVELDMEQEDLLTLDGELSPEMRERLRPLYEEMLEKLPEAAKRPDVEYWQEEYALRTGFEFQMFLEKCLEREGKGEKEASLALLRHGVKGAKLKLDDWDGASYIVAFDENDIKITAKGYEATGYEWQDVEENGGHGSFSIATESAQRVEPTPEEAFTRMDVDGPGMSGAEYGKLSKEERDKRGDKYGRLPQDEKERIATPGLNAVYAKAAEVQEDFRKIVEGVGAKLGLKVMMRTGLKGRERAMQKTTTDYHGDAGQLLDVFGGTLILSADNSFSEVEKEIRAAGMEVVRVKNGYIKKDDYGYADIKMNVKMPNGFIGEIILIEDSKNKVKFGIGHKIYEAGRAIQAELKDNEKNPDYDPERRRLATELVEALQRWSTACYTGASTEARQAMIEEAKEAYQRGLAYILHSSNVPSVQTPLDWEGEGINTVGRAQSEESSKSLYNWNTSPSLVAPQAPSWSPLVQNLIKSASSALNIEDSINADGRNVNQENTDSGSFSVIGPHARTWDKYADRAFAGRDDGKMRAEIDASQARLTGERETSLPEDVNALLGRLAEGDEQLEQLFKFCDAWDRYLELIRNEARLTEKEKEELRGLQNWVPDTREELKVLANRVLSAMGYDTALTGRGAADRVEKLQTAALLSDVKTLKKYNRYRKERARKLSEVLDYPELFEAYPELKEIKVDGNETLANGAYYSPVRTISLNNRLLSDANERRSVLLHEVQHAIQDIEGFAAGGNPAKARQEIRNAIARHDVLLDERDRFEALPEEMKDMPLVSSNLGKAEKAYEESKKTQEALDAELDKKRNAGEEPSDEEIARLTEAINRTDGCLRIVDYCRHGARGIKTARDRLTELNDSISRFEDRLRELNMGKNLSDYELYLRLPGEIESRNVQERRDWTAEQRQATPFNDTLEYPGEAMSFGSFSVTEAKEKKLFDKDGIMQAANGILIDGTSFALTAMHASPHWIQKKFRLDKIGTGEGAQMFGSGMYFTEDDRVNDKYLRQFRKTDPGRFFVNGKEVSTDDLKKIVPSLTPCLLRACFNGNVKEKAREEVTRLRERIEKRRRKISVYENATEWPAEDQKWFEFSIASYAESSKKKKRREHARLLERMPAILRGEIKELREELSDTEKLLAWLEEGNTLEWKKIEEPAYNYRVEIDMEEGEFFYWDDLMTDESNAGALERLRNSPVVEVRELAEAVGANTGEKFYWALAKKMRKKYGLGDSRSEKAQAARYASEALLASGIKGHKYADGFTRGKEKSERKYNEVAYDMDAIRITHVARGNRDWKPYVPREEEEGFSASLVDMARDARFMLRRREDDLEGEELVERWDWMLARLETASTESESRRDGSARMGAITALLEATRSVLPPAHARLGRLNMLMKWAAVYAHMVSTGEVKRDGALKGPVFEKFAAAMMEKSAAWREDGLLEGMTEEEAKDALRQLGEVRLDEALLKVAKECRARLDKFVKARARERIELTAERTWPKKERGRKSPRGKMEAERYRGMNAMLAWMDADADEVSRRQDEIRARLDKLEGEEPLDEDKAAEKAALEEETRIIQLFGDWEGMTAQQARIAADDFNEYVLTGRHKWEEKIERERRRREWEKMNMDFSEESDANTRSAQKREGGLKNIVKHGIKSFATNTMSYSQLMLAAKRVFGERFTRERVQEIADANAALRRARRDRDDAFARALMKATGLTGKAELTDWLNRFGKEEKRTGIILRQVTNRTLEMTRDEARAWVNMTAGERERRRQELREEAERERLSAPNIPEERDMDKLREELARLDSKKSRAAKVKIKVPRRGKAIELTASRDAVANALLLLEQEDYQHLIEYEGLEPRDAQGNIIDREKDTETPIDIDQTLKPLRDFVGEDGVRFVRALQEYVGKNGREMQKVYEDRQGVPFPMKRGYWRGNFNINTVKEKDTLTEQNGMMGGGGYGFLIDRVKHYNRLEWTNTATMVFGVTVEQQNNYEPRTAQSVFIALRT